MLCLTLPTPTTCTRTRTRTPLAEKGSAHPMQRPSYSRKSGSKLGGLGVTDGLNSAAGPVYYLLRPLPPVITGKVHTASHTGDTQGGKGTAGCE